MSEAMAKRKYYLVSFPDLDRIVLEAIVRQRKHGYSEIWLRKRFEEIPKKQAGEKK